jgi:phage terminase large subunit
MTNIATIELPPKLVELFSGEARYRCAYGGRGSGKSRSFAIMAAVRGYIWGNQGRSGQILCAREFMNSLSDSSFEEVSGAIESYEWLAEYYEVGERYIRSRDGNIEFTFAGLRRNLDSIKSKARILLCWVDEAETVSAIAWDKLDPTIREEGSELWVSWNPESNLSATHLRFRADPPKSSKIVEINWKDNPYFPKVLELVRQNDFEKRPENYDHIWEGAFLTHHEGAYYSLEMRDANAQGRITAVPYETRMPVITAWDLGIGDTTAIWFAQKVGPETRLIDHYETAGVGLDHYVRVLQQKGYIYDQHILPHDVRVRELGSGKSRLETLQSLGLNNIQIAPQLNVDDGIQAVRSLLATCWFDAEKCSHGIDALRAYHRDYDDNNRVWKGRPAHDWSSHSADAFRYLAVGHRETSNWGEPIRRNLQGIA